MSLVSNRIHSAEATQLLGCKGDVVGESVQAIDMLFQAVRKRRCGRIMS